MRVLIVLILIAAVVFFFLADREVAQPPGVLAPDPPSQQKVTDQPVFTFEDYTVTPLASYSIRARVLSKKSYRRAADGHVVPFDLALGWGPMSDTEVLKDIKITQSGRWYRWQVDQFPIPRKSIEQHSANVHIIPASDETYEELRHIRKGDMVCMSGFLVSIRGPDGQKWRSSTTRKDHGANSCELMFVSELRIEERPSDG